MHPIVGDVASIFRPSIGLGRTVVVVLLLGLGPVLWGQPAHGQVDTTDAPSADTAATVPADTTGAPPDTAGAPRPDASAQAQDVPDNPRSFPGPTYGRPPIDSLPTLTPHVGLEHILAQKSGSFLYDLGAVGWPHGWSPDGLGPHQSRLWINGQPYNSPLTGRSRFDLLPPSFLERPAIGTDPGGSAVGVHVSWRDYDQIRPITELRFRRDSNGQKAIEVGHSQKHQVSLFGAPGLFQATFGYGGRTTGGAYHGSDLRRERRIWGRLRYQRADWAVEVSDLSSRRRIGAHSGVVPPTETASFGTIYVLPSCESCSQNPNTRRRTYRNDLTARIRGPLVPGLSSPTDLSATWTSNTFDFKTGLPSDTMWTVKVNGGHGAIEQAAELGTHTLTFGARGSLWNVARSNVPQIDGARWSAHAFGRDSVRALGADVTVDAGWHVTSSQQYPSGSIQLDRPLGPFRFSAEASATRQRVSWFETAGYRNFIQPLQEEAPADRFGRILRGKVGLEYRSGPVNVQAEGFAHQVRNAIDLYAATPPDSQRVASTDSVTVQQTSTPVRRVGATVSLGWRRDASRGLYFSGNATALTTLSANASSLQTRLARTVPKVYGRGRIGARFVFFTDLITDLYVQARGWTAMNSRWFHPPTGRLSVPPANTPIPSRPNTALGPSGTIDVHAEIKLRGATLFFTFENVQASFAPVGTQASGWDQLQRQATIEPGTFVVPVYPLPARQFRFGVHWPIFD